jgi:hypothetical protein
MRGNRSGAIVATVKLRYRLLLAVEHTSCGSGLRAQAIEGFVQQHDLMDALPRQSEVVCKTSIT